VYEKSLNEAERILATRGHVIVAVKEIWGEVCKRAREQRFETASLVDFTAMLEADDRFDLLSEDATSQRVEVDEGIESEDGGESIQLGFGGEDRVKLRRFRLRTDEAAEEEESTPSIVRGISVSASRATAGRIHASKKNRQNGNGGRARRGKRSFKAGKANHTRK